MLARQLWEAKMCALTSAIERAAATAKDVDGLEPPDIALAMLISAVSYMRTTKGFSTHIERELIQEAQRAVPRRELAPQSGLIVVQ